MWWIPKFSSSSHTQPCRCFASAEQAAELWPIPSNLRLLPDKLIPTNVLIADGFALLISEELNKITQAQLPCSNTKQIEAGNYRTMPYVWHCVYVCVCVL